MSNERWLYVGRIGRRYWWTREGRYGRRQSTYRPIKEFWPPATVEAIESKAVMHITTMEEEKCQYPQ